MTELERRGWAEVAKSKAPVGYEPRSVNLWSLSWTEGCVQALALRCSTPSCLAERLGLEQHVNIGAA